MALSLISGSLTKVLAAASAILLASSLILVWAYLGIRDDLATLKQKHAQLEQSFKECGEEKERNKISYGQDLDIISGLGQTKIDISSSTEASLQKLRNIPTKSCKPIEVKNEDETIYVDIDAPFDDEFRRVFTERSKNKRSSSSSSRQSTK